MLNLQDGKRYYMPSLTDKPFYDGGLILREDYLESKGLEAPKTFDDLYEILKAYKADYPDSYPVSYTHLDVYKRQGTRDRPTMPPARRG